MEAKKSVSANLENQKDLFLLIGFVVVLGLMYIAFEWTKQEITVYQDTTSDVIIEDEEIVMQTVQNQPPPPPAPEPPVVTPEIVVVEEDVKTNTDAFISESKKTDVPIVAPIAPPVVDEPDDNVVFVAVEKQPEFPGGIQKLYEFLGKKMNYPTAAKEAGIQGRVICQFVVNKDGSIVDVVVVKGVDPDLDAEAIRVIKMMPKWNAGEQSGKKVRVKYTLPVLFRIQ